MDSNAPMFPSRRSQSGHFELLRSAPWAQASVAFMEVLSLLFTQALRFCFKPAEVFSASESFLGETVIDVVDRRVLFRHRHRHRSVVVRVGSEQVD